MKFTLNRQSKVQRTPRFIQVRDKFSMESDGVSRVAWAASIDLPESWNVGLVIGASGGGKTTLARELAQRLDAMFVTPKDAEGRTVEPFDWPADQCVVDGFPASCAIADIVGLLSSVGFSSPPSWLQPFATLSIGEQFRATVARVMAECAITKKPGIIDEFANNVDVTAAKIGSAAISKAVRRAGTQLVAVTCRDDVAEYLEPDWVIRVAKGEPIKVELTGANAGRGSLRRPPIDLQIVRADRSAWSIFRPHHYLDHNIHKSAKCFVGLVDGVPAAFASVIFFPHPSRPSWREHRTVCLPTFQGVGIGNAMSEYVASLFVATDRPYTSTTSHPAMMRHRAKSKLWKMTRKPTIANPHGPNGSTAMAKTSADNRLTAGFEYVGPARADQARRAGVID